MVQPGSVQLHHKPGRMCVRAPARRSGSPVRYSRGVFVSCDMVCSQGSGSGDRSGQFTQRTPVNRILPKPYTYPDQCVLSAEAQLNVGGTLHLWLTRNR